MNRSNPWIARALYGACLTITTLIWASPTLADSVMITDDANDNAENYRNTGLKDVIPLRALFYSDSTQEYSGEINDFIWTSDANGSQIDECNPSNNDDCLLNSNFQVNDDGVMFYVPEGAPERIVIRAIHKNTGLEGTFTLNVDTSVNLESGILDQVGTDPSEHRHTQFTDDSALNVFGRWISLAGIRYFVPYRQSEDWAPYRNGTWTQHNGDYSWVSLDPWGSYTDHYGFWRHHNYYGWIWTRSPNREYRPHRATFFYQGDHVGWVPVHQDDYQYYTAGAEQGFDDGYWLYRRGIRITRDMNFFPGFTVILGRHFNTRNVYDVRIDLNSGWGFYQDAWRGRYYGRWPYRSSFERSYAYFHEQYGFNLPGCHYHSFEFSNFNMSRCGYVYPVPAHYRFVHPRQIFGGRRHVPIGSVIVRSDRGGPRYIAPRGRPPVYVSPRRVYSQPGSRVVPVPGQPRRLPPPAHGRGRVISGDRNGNNPGPSRERPRVPPRTRNDNGSQTRPRTSPRTEPGFPRSEPSRSRMEPSSPRSEPSRSRMEPSSPRSEPSRSSGSGSGPSDGGGSPSRTRAPR